MKRVLLTLALCGAVVACTKRESEPSWDNSRRIPAHVVGMMDTSWEGRALDVVIHDLRDQIQRLEARLQRLENR